MNKSENVIVQTLYIILFSLLLSFSLVNVQGQNGISAKDEINSRETVLTDKLTYTWIIKEFSKLSNDSNFSLLSPIFPEQERTESNQKIQWQIEFYPNQQSNYYVLYWNALNCNYEVSAKITSSVRNCKTDYEYQRTVSSYKKTFRANCKRNQRSGDSRWICKTDVQNCFAGDTFEIRFIIETAHTDEQTLLTSTATDRTNDSFTTLKNNYQSLFAYPSFSDLVIKTDGAELQVHKNILAARSPVFWSILNNNNLDQIEVSDIDKETMVSLLAFIYTGNPHLYGGANESKRLLLAAEKYALLDLKLYCENRVMKNCNISNALDILIFANRHNFSNLKNEVVKYIAKNIRDFSNIKLTGLNKELAIQVISRVSQTDYPVRLIEKC